MLKYREGLRLTLTLEHVQHSLRDDETATDVDKGEQDAHGAKELRDGFRQVTSTQNKEPSDADHAGDCVGDAHQRRVQGGNHAPDNPVAD